MGEIESDMECQVRLQQRLGLYSVDQYGVVRAPGNRELASCRINRVAMHTRREPSFRKDSDAKFDELKS